MFVRRASRQAALPLAWFFAPAVARTALLAQTDVAVGLSDVHGYVVDALVAVVLALLTAPLLARSRWVGLLFLPWGLLNYASYEFTRTMNAVPPWQSIRYLGDRTFLEGSAVVVSNPLLLGLVAVASVACVWLSFRRFHAKLLPLATPAGALGIAALVWPANHAVLAWRQTNFVAGNAVDMVSPAQTGDLPPLSPERELELDRLFHADLRGMEIVPTVPNRPNVLFVLIEGIAGTDLPSIGERHRHPGAASMPRLDAIGRKNLYFTSFVTHQRGTNRGLYASLCGDYPKLGTATAKMTEKAAGPDLDCLPAVLRKSGYETVFLQAAPLAFMLKDSFMPRAGFSQSIGGEHFEKAYARSNWGVDDRAFFEGVREKVRELRAAKKPWMMSLLTIGTHHPYPVPDSFAADEPPGSFRRAARYTDEAIDELVRGLDSDGALSDTIVLITSDESHGLPEGGDDLTKLLTQNLSFFVAIVPSRQQRVVDEVFAQSDTALSVLDLLGLADASSPFVGRSMFRAYAEPRRVFIANQNARTIGMIDSAQRNVWTCDERLSACDHLQLGAPSFVSPARIITSPSREEVSFLSAAQARAAGTDVSPFRELRLTSDALVPVIAKDEQLLYAGQYLDLPAASTVDVDLELEVLGAGELSLASDLVADAGGRTLARPEPFALKTGQSVVLRYTVRNDTEAHWVEARAMARRIGDADVSIRFSHATLRIRATEPSDAPGFVVRERTVKSPSGVD